MMSTNDRTSVPGSDHGRPGAAPLPEPSVVPLEGWHCGHYFYRFRREMLDGPLPELAREQLRLVLSPNDDVKPKQLGSWWISGHECDFGIMLMDPNPAKVDGLHQRMMAPPLGKYLEPVWSFISMSEISEYVLSIDGFRQKLLREGAEPGSPELEAKVSGYERRLPMMNQNRLYPEFPEWPVACFYPMNKSRVPGANWFTEAFSHRNAMMSEHAQSGIAFAGKVSQLISVGVGLDDWEWMVTLWGRNPTYLKEIVYKMRFDEASAKYAEFGRFYVGYNATADEILRHCHLSS